MLLALVVFIKLTAMTGLPIWINPQQIAGISQEGAGSDVLFSGGANVRVQESTREVFQHMKDAGFSVN